MMLEYIRDSAQSFGVKVAFGVIILVFVFWGVGNFNDRDYSNIVAVVNGEPILAYDFEKAYGNAEQYILRNNPGMTRERLVKDRLGRQVFSELVQTALMEQAARRAGIEVTPLELLAAVSKNKAFQDENGKFDPEAYKRVLAGQRLTAARFEKDLSSEILRDKMFGLITASAWVDPDEARNRYDYLRERRIADYLFIPASRFMDKVEITGAEARTWYDNHKDDFAIPPQVDVEYVAVSPEALVKPETVGEDAARLWFEANKGDFDRPEQARVAHILVPVAADADELALKAAGKRLDEARKALAAGKTFAAVADEFNAEGAAGPGGELGWIRRGQTVQPFEDAVFSLQPGVVSQEVRTPFGLHLILVEEKKAGGVPSFEEIVEEAKKGAARDSGLDKLHDALDNLVEDNILGKPLADSASRHGLKAEASGLLDKKGLVEKLGVDEKGAEALLATPQGSPLDTVLESGERYIVARVVKSAPAGVRPFEEVKSGLVDSLKAEKAEAMALAEATAILEKARARSFSEKEASELGLKTSQPIERGGVFADFMPNLELNRAIFDTKPGNWLEKAFSVSTASGRGALAARVARALPPDPGEFASVEEIMSNGVKRERMEAIYALFMQSLLDSAEVEITNQSLIDRVNM